MFQLSLKYYLNAIKLFSDRREHSRLREARTDDWWRQGGVGGDPAELWRLWEPQVRAHLRPGEVEDGRQEGAATLVQGSGTTANINNY